MRAKRSIRWPMKSSTISSRLKRMTKWRTTKFFLIQPQCRMKVLIFKKKKKFITTASCESSRHLLVPPVFYFICACLWPFMTNFCPPAPNHPWFPAPLFRVSQFLFFFCSSSFVTKIHDGKCFFGSKLFFFLLI